MRWWKTEVDGTIGMQRALNTTHGAPRKLPHFALFRPQAAIVFSFKTETTRTAR